VHTLPAAILKYIYKEKSKLGCLMKFHSDVMIFECCRPWTKSENKKERIKKKKHNDNNRFLKNAKT
jgi:hypothetical protein